MPKVILLSVLVGFWGCSHLFYHPDSFLYSTPDQFNIDFKSERFPSKNGNDLHAWILSPKRKKPKSTVLFFHGNAQNLSSHYLHLAWLTQFGHEVLVFDYQGYGRSRGKPSQQTTYEDGLAALEWAYKHHQEVESPFFWVYGQSLGGVIAMRSLIDYRNKDLVNLLVLDSTFDSYQDVAFSKLKTSIFFPLSPVAYGVVSDKYSVEGKLSQISMVPTLFIHGTKDQVVDFDFGKELHDEFPGKKKWFWKVKDGVHTDVFWNHEREYRGKFLSFLTERRLAPLDE